MGHLFLGVYSWVVVCFDLFSIPSCWQSIHVESLYGIAMYVTMYPV